MNSKTLAIAACCFPVVIMSVLAGCRWQAASDVKQKQDPARLVSAQGDNKGAAKSSDCPMFGGTPQRNMVNTIDKNTPTSWSVEEGKQKNIKWVAALGNHAYGGPVIADGKVFVGTNQKDKTNKAEKAVLMAFNEADGKFLWKIVHEFPDDPVFSQARGEGLCSTPVIEGKRLYYVTPGCEVVCADTAGKIVWTYDMMKNLKVVPFHLSNCSPLIAGDLVLLLTGNGTDEEGKVVSPKAPSFIAVNKKTGVLAWQSNLPGDKVIEGQFTNPTLATLDGKSQVIFAAGDGVIYSFEPSTGTLIWKCDCLPTRKTKQDRGIDNHFMATPVVVGDRLYVGMGICPGTGNATKSGYVLCIDITKKGDVSFKSYDAKAPANKNSALVWAFGGMIEPRPEKGRDARFGSTLSTAAVHDGLLYIGEEPGYLHCLDAKTGQRYWVHDLQASVWGSPYCVDGKVYICTDEGSVFAFVHGKKRQWYVDGKIRTPDGSKDDRKPTAELDDGVLSTPVVANGVLYIATKSKLYAIR